MVEVVALDALVVATEKGIRVIRRSSILKLAVVAITSATLTGMGCAHDEAARYYLETKFPARPIEEVELFRAPPKRAYIVMADFQARNTSANQMRARAAEIGADGVIVTLLGGYADQEQVWATDDKYSTTYSRITATAIRFK